LLTPVAFILNIVDTNFEIMAERMEARGIEVPPATSGTNALKMISRAKADID
jgi:hypothetical protein